MLSLEQVVFVNSAPSSECFHPPATSPLCQRIVSSFGFSFCQNNEAKEVLKTCSCQIIDGFLAYVITGSSFVCFF